MFVLARGSRKVFYDAGRPSGRTGSTRTGSELDPSLDQPVLDLQLFDPDKVAKIAGDQRQIVDEGDRRDSKIGFGQGRARAFKACAELAIYAARGLVEREDLNIRPDQLIELGEEMIPASAPIRTVDQFADRDCGGELPTGRNAREPAKQPGGWIFSQHGADRIRVEEVHYRSRGTRLSFALRRAVERVRGN